MGARLVREVIRTMPPTIKPTEWKLVVLLADELSSVTRSGPVKGGQPSICERMGLSEASLKRSLTRLAELGYELRVPIGKNKDGVPIFACNGVATTYRIPDFRVAEGAQK